MIDRQRWFIREKFASRYLLSPKGFFFYSEIKMWTVIIMDAATHKISSFYKTSDHFIDL